MADKKTKIIDFQKEQEIKEISEILRGLPFGASLTVRIELERAKENYARMRINPCPAG